MSATTHTRPAALVAAYDDPRAPSEVTLYPSGIDAPTQWLTIDVEHAVPLTDAV